MNVMSVHRARQEGPEQLGRHDGREAPDDVRDPAVVDWQRPAPAARPELSVAVVGRLDQGARSSRFAIVRPLFFSTVGSAYCVSLSIYT